MADQSSRSRRAFIRTSAMAVAGAAAIREAPAVRASRGGSAPIRIGVIGCGGRGTGAVLNALQAGTRVIYPKTGYHTEDAAENARARAEDVQVLALADLFPDRLGACREQLGTVGVEVPTDACFTGFDAYRKLLEMDEINYVILATPPHFRPEHLMATVEAGKHAFVEKPGAVDAPGVRTVLAAGELAEAKGLGIVAGTQRRHQASYVETVRRIREGAIGDVRACRTYWNGGVVWSIPREEGWSDLEWQLRNWGYFTWLSGDHIVEQHVHNLDVANWVLGEHPVRATALGGRQARFGEVTGNIYDHFAVEYEYASGIRMYSQCRQMDGCENRVEEIVEGSAGTAKVDGMIRGLDGKVAWRFRDPDAPNPYEQEHVDLMASIRAGEPLNEARAFAESTLTGIMGRESAYSGKSITWDEALASTRDYRLSSYAFGEIAFPEVAIPGRYELV